MDPREGYQTPERMLDPRKDAGPQKRMMDSRKGCWIPEKDVEPQGKRRWILGCWTQEKHDGSKKSMIRNTRKRMVDPEKNVGPP
jgi:hypothetical protein